MNPKIQTTDPIASVDLSNPTFQNCQAPSYHRRPRGLLAAQMAVRDLLYHVMAVVLVDYSRHDAASFVWRLWSFSKTDPWVSMDLFVQSWTVLAGYSYQESPQGKRMIRWVSHKRHNLAFAHHSVLFDDGIGNSLSRSRSSVWAVNLGVRDIPDFDLGARFVDIDSRYIRYFTPHFRYSHELSNTRLASGKQTVWVVLEEMEKLPIMNCVVIPIILYKVVRKIMRSENKSVDMYVDRQKGGSWAAPWQVINNTVLVEIRLHQQDLPVQ